MKISISDDKHLCIENNDESNPHFIKGELQEREFHVKKKDLSNHGFSDKDINHIRELSNGINLFIDD